MFDFLNHLFKHEGQNEGVSLSEMITGNKKKSAEQAKLDLLNALNQTDAQKNYYSTLAKRAIVSARTAISKGDETGKRIAYNELKFAYGVYQYMSALHNSFRIIKSNTDMIGMTETLASVIDGLSQISVPASSLNFDKLTAKALRGFKGVDMSGLEGMLQKLIEGSLQATNVSGASDAFLDKLINGEVSLDTPYTEPVENKVEEQPAQEEPKDTVDDTAALLAALDKINASLKNG